MEDKELQISKVIFSSQLCFGEPQVSMSWVEDSSNHLYSDRDGDIDISKEEALELIKFLSDSFNLEPNETSR